MNLLNKTPEQRRTLRNWVFVAGAIGGGAVLCVIIYALAFHIPDVPLQRVQWLGWLGMAVVGLLLFDRVVFGMEISLRILKLAGGKDGFTLEAGDDGDGK